MIPPGPVGSHELSSKNKAMIALMDDVTKSVKQDMSTRFIENLVDNFIVGTHKPHAAMKKKSGAEKAP